MEWTNFNYKSHVLGLEDYEKVYGTNELFGEKKDYKDIVTLGKVNHFQWMARNNQKAIPRNKKDYLDVFRGFQSDPDPLRKNGGFTYAFPNHFSQNLLSKELRENLKSLNQEIMYGS